MNFLASPELVTAMSYSGRTDFNPMTDSIPLPDGKQFRFEPPSGIDLPDAGFAIGNPEFQPSPPTPDASVSVAIDPSSDRLAVLEPFDAFPNGELSNMKVLVKVKGQCTTDTISAAGPWLKYKGHLPNISENTLIGAVSADTNAVNSVTDLDGTTHTIPELASKWKQEGQPWIVVAEHNYGEGSAREHAALQPRYLGCRVVLAKSFARIHETNLKKQGVVPLTFVNEEDYDKMQGCDEVSTEGLHDLLQNGGSGTVHLLVKQKGSGAEFRIPAKHTLSKDQCGFILAGSALNLLSQRSDNSVTAT